MKYAIIENRIIYENIQDFDLAETFLCGQAFRFDPYRDGFKGFIKGQLCYLYFVQDSLYVEVQNYAPTQEFAQKVYHFLALDVDYAEIKRKFSVDATMKKAISYAQGIRVLNQDFFETLITFIISQNNNIPRIKKLADTLCERYGDKVGDSFIFPVPEQLAKVTQEDFAQMKFGFRARYLCDAVQKVLQSEVSAEIIKALPYEKARECLMQIKGVGPKVADCVLLFGCERYESFPKDVWINRAMGVMFKDGLPEACRGLEGIAQQYIFHYARFNLEK